MPGKNKRSGNTDLCCNSYVEQGLAAEIVEANILFRDSHFVKHLQHSRVHKRRAAQIELNVFRSRMFLEVVIKQTLVNEAYVTVAFFVIKALLDFPVVFRKRFAETNVKLEVRKLLFNLPEVIYIEQFLFRTTPIPVRHFPIGAFRVKQMEYLRTQRRHSGP